MTATATSAAAQPFTLGSGALTDAATLDAAMPALARQLLAVYREPDRRAHLDTLFRLQLAAGRYTDAPDSIAAMRAAAQGRFPPSLVGALAVPYEIFARAKTRHGTEQIDEALRQSFRDVFARLDDQTAAMVRIYSIDVAGMRRSLESALQPARDQHPLSLDDALRLVSAYQLERTYAVLAPLAAVLNDAEDRRRYLIDKDVLVRTPDGATVCALVMRPRDGASRLPALLNFTIYSDPTRTASEARRTASHGYAAVEGYTRGKACSPDRPVPIEHDGADAAALIDWIAAQPWSNARVGMYGGSYEGFTQWAAAKHMPRALQALMPLVSFAPGVDAPMPGGVFWSDLYPWPFYTTNTKTLDDATYGDRARWSRLNHEWYVSGRAYAELEQIDDTPNPIWRRWLDHPSYDDDWRRVIPDGGEFARINIPVLTTTGYYDDGQLGALHYFREHDRHNPGAEHYLVIGPYDHISGQRGTPTGPSGALPPLRGYTLDPVAEIDIGELRYQWFDYVFRGAPKPALLQDRVNYEVMGGNVWKHAPTLAVMATRRRTFYLAATPSGGPLRLSEIRPVPATVIPLTVDLADRSDAEQLRAAPSASDSWNGIASIVDKTLSTRNGIAFVSAPFSRPTELSGSFSGRLRFVTNKKDFDFDVQLYELTPEGDYVQLSYYWARASYVRDRSRRQLLQPGRRQALDFESALVTSRQIRPGSRLAVVLSVLKRSDMEINYGSGKEVSRETIADAGAPLTIRWSSDSCIAVPVGD